MAVRPAYAYSCVDSNTRRTHLEGGAGSSLPKRTACAWLLTLRFGMRARSAGRHERRTIAVRPDLSEQGEHRSDSECAFIIIVLLPERIPRRIRISIVHVIRFPHGTMAVADRRFGFIAWTEQDGTGYFTLAYGMHEWKLRLRLTTQPQNSFESSSRARATCGRSRG